MPECDHFDNRDNENLECDVSWIKKVWEVSEISEIGFQDTT